MTKEIETLIKKCRSSSFNRSNYSVNVDLKYFVNSMLLHTDYDNKSDGYAWYDKEYNLNWLTKVTPQFQRSNDKWSKGMQKRFIENLLMGAKTELLLFKMAEFEDSKIIDGLQRTTAIIDFLNGDIKPFGYQFDELKEYLRQFPNHNLVIKIYTFDTWEEVGRFYIDMNENITHSSEDIQKAKDWFLSEHGIEL